ncbi:hypothetical protein ABZS66_46740 [Dactylosporangium sp. NPDC005572]|uniref:hypothetical protein n=1 Tax=Dactylosporangium sp. NPDC005572 TaxID=3156889 RepID=UPI0033BE04F7
MRVHRPTLKHLLPLLAVATLAAALLAAPPAAAAADTCGGPLTFGQVAVCSALTTEPDVFTVTTTRANDKLFVMTNGGTGSPIGFTLADRQGTVLCYLHTGECQLARAGTYTITAALQYGESGNYTISVESMRTPSACTTLPGTFFSFASTGVTGTLPEGSAGTCFRFNQPVGSVLQLWAPATGSVQGTILDGQFQPVCPVRYATTCRLTTPGPYSLNLYDYYGNASPYTLRMARISNAAGCAPLRLAAFGDPGAQAGTGNLPANDGVGCHRLRMPSAGSVAIRIFNSQSLFWQLYDDAGNLVCDSTAPRSSCSLPAAGDYTVITTNRDWNPVSYQIAAPALFRNAGCAPGTSLSWAQDALVVHQTSAIQTNCQPFHGNAGDRVVLYSASVNYNYVSSWLVDSSGAALCTSYSPEDGCVLPATGTYRVLSFLAYWDSGSTDEAYKLQVRRLSQPAGCPVVRPGAYNAAPAGALGPVRCRILNIATPGTYIARPYSADNTLSYASVYDSTGHRICDDSAYCQIPAAGRYTMVLDGRVPNSVIDNDFAYVTTLLPIQPAGCPAVADDGAAFRAEFTAPGQYLCRQLPGAAGTRVVELQPTDATGAANPTAIVVDATGAFVCDGGWQLRQSSCQLNGTAPFSAVLTESGGNAPGAFTTAFRRVDGPPACTELPRGADGATVPADADHFAFCFTIPAGQHASRETFTWQRTAGAGRAVLSVFDAGGLRYCGPTPAYDERTVTCTLPEGPVTVILETGAVTGTYRLTHQDGTTP